MNLARTLHERTIAPPRVETEKQRRRGNQLNITSKWRTARLIDELPLARSDFPKLPPFLPSRRIARSLINRFVENGRFFDSNFIDKKPRDEWISFGNFNSTPRLAPLCVLGQEIQIKPRFALQQYTVRSPPEGLNLTAASVTTEMENARLLQTRGFIPSVRVAQ